jgi:hypothetical protein
VRIIDYDDISTWGALVGAVVTAVGPAGLIPALVASNPEYIEDAGDFVEAAVGRDRLVEALFQGLDGERVRVWHGTRVTDPEAESIRTHGLRPLTTADRSAGCCQSNGSASPSRRNESRDVVPLGHDRSPFSQGG